MSKTTHQTLAGLIVVGLLCVGTSALAAVHPKTPASSSESFAIGLGAGMNTPLGSNYLTLGSGTVVSGSVWMGTDLMGAGFPLKLSVNYTPYNMKNMSDAKLHIVEAFVGFEARSPKLDGFLNPLVFVSLEIGGAMQSLSIPNQQTSNSAGAVAMQMVPGLEFGLMDSISLRAEFPFTAAFFKTTLTNWGGVGALKVKF